MYIQRLVLIFLILSTLNINETTKENINSIWNDITEVANEEEVIDEEIEETIEINKFDIYGLNLNEGILSDEVLRLKSFLKVKGYLDTEEGYYFDTNIKNAVMKYQADNAIKVNGKVGRQTYEKINQDMELNQISIPQVELEFTHDIPQESWLIINKDSNTLYHLHKEEVINKYPVATGKTPSHTPEGKFTIVTKYKNPAWGGAGRFKPIRGGDPNNPLGKRWMGLSLQGGGVYGIHGNSNKESIGRYVSLGCIRMFNEDVVNLYDLIEKDTILWIGNEKRLNTNGVFFNIDNKKDWRKVSYTNPLDLQF